MTFPTRLLAPAALLLLAACSPYHVRYDYDSTASFAAYRTFDWYASSKRGGGQQLGPFIEKRVKASVEGELGAKGFQRETVKDPDFLVNVYPIYHVRKVHTSTGVRMGFGGPGWRAGVGTRTGQTHRYKEGTLVVEVIDYRSNQLVWQGGAEGALNPYDDPEESTANISGAVKEILDRFPPK